MATLPYVTTPGNLDRALRGIKSAAVPEKVSQDFVKTILKIPGGSGNQVTSMLKKLGFTTSDGSPSQIYRSFRNSSSSGVAMANAIRHAYSPIYVRNEYAHELSDADIQGLIIEETGQSPESSVIKLVLSCWKTLKSFADFSNKDDGSSQVAGPKVVEAQPIPAAVSPQKELRSIGLNLGYTINLNLPATSDPAVFDAIFRSLKSNLLRDEDA